MEIPAKSSFREPLNGLKTKHGMNVPSKVLIKCRYFGADVSSNIAARMTDLLEHRA